MHEVQADCPQQELLPVQNIPEKSITRTIPMARVAENRMADMSEMTPELVLSAGQGMKLQERQTNGLITTDRDRNLGAPKAAVFSLCGLFFGHILLRPKIVVDQPAIVRPSPDHRQITFIDRLSRELSLHAAERIFIQSEEQDSAGRPIQPVARKDIQPDLIPQTLHRELRSQCVQLRAMHEQSSRLINRDEIGVLVEDR